MGNFRRIEHVAGRMLPKGVKDVVGRAYNWVRVRRADHDYEPINVARRPSEDTPKHVIILVIDALRYDFLSTTTAPFLATRGPAKAVAPATWTTPSVASLLTGRYPHEHGAMRGSDDPEGASEGEITVPSLSPDETTLPEILGGYGVKTYGGFGFEMPFLVLRSRFHQHRLYRNASAEVVLADHRSWLLSRADQQTFSYLHLSDLHVPLDPPTQYVKEFNVDTNIDDLSGWQYTDVTDPTIAVRRYIENKRQLYRAVLRYTDDVVADYYKTIRDALGSDVLVVLTSDHGEGFWDHAPFDAEHFVDSRPAYCVGHGGTPYECVTRVPLWFSGQSMRGDEHTSLVDIVPTLLDMFGILETLPTTGRSLLLEPRKERPLLTEAARYGHEKKAVYEDKWKLIVSKGDNITVECCIDEEPEGGPIPDDVREQMLAQLPSWLNSNGGDSQRVSNTVKRRLKSLGYS